MDTLSTPQRQYLTLSLILILLLPIGSFGLTYISDDSSFISGRLPRSSSSTLDFDLSGLPPINYETLNNSWYGKNIDMLIIVPNGRESFREAVEPLAQWKNQKGVRTLILSNYSSYEGYDDPEKIRNMIKSYYESDGIQWVLLAGDAQDDLIPIRYAHNPDLKDFRDMEVPNIPPEPLGDEVLKPTDFYYADLNGTWDSNGNHIWGESAEYNQQGGDEISWDPEVYVGRLPASNAYELSLMINKTLKYEKNPEIGDWMNRMLLAGGISSMPTQKNPDGEDEARLTTFIWQNYVQNQMNFTHLARNTFYTPPDPKETLSRQKFTDEIDSGYSTVIYAGHGTFDKFEDDMRVTIFTSLDANDTANPMPSLVYADACATATYDHNNNSIGELLIKDGGGGAIGYVGALRITLYFDNDNEFEALNRGNAKLFWKVFFEDHTYKQGKALYDSKVAYMNSHYYLYERDLDFEQAERKNLLTYCLLGDPEVDIYTDVPGIISENPLPSRVYEGQMVELNIKDNYSRPVSNPRVYMYNKELGIGRTVYGDGTGNVKFRLPLGAGITYNVSISGHNIIRMSNFSFTTLPDSEDPEILSADLLTKRPSISTNLHFLINTSDDASGIESVIVVFSIDDFNSYFTHQFKNEFEENEYCFEFQTNKLKPGTYRYLIFLRDYTNKTDIMYETSYQIIISVPITLHILIGTIIGIAAVGLVSTIIYLRSSSTYPDTIEKLQRAQQ